MYCPLSVKDSESKERLIFLGYLLCTINENQKTPIQSQKFLRSSKNNESLVLFIVMHWKPQVPEGFNRKTGLATLRIFHDVSS